MPTATRTPYSRTTLKVASEDENGQLPWRVAAGRTEAEVVVTALWQSLGPQGTFDLLVTHLQHSSGLEGWLPINRLPRRWLDRHRTNRLLDNDAHLDDSVRYLHRQALDVLCDPTGTESLTTTQLMLLYNSVVVRQQQQQCLLPCLGSVDGHLVSWFVPRNNTNEVRWVSAAACPSLGLRVRCSPREAEKAFLRNLYITGLFVVRSTDGHRFLAEQSRVLTQRLLEHARDARGSSASCDAAFLDPPSDDDDPYVDPYSYVITPVP